MRASELFTKTRKEIPKDEVSKNAELLVRAGFVHKEMAGAYSYLPLGLRVLKKIENIIREEMNMIGGQEVSLTALQDPAIWQKTDRWDDEKYNVWFKTQLKNGSLLGLATTHEEPLAQLIKEHISSYKDLPRYVYQFQTKFRNELRAKSGLLRGREFLMKDMYSFNRSKEEFEIFYEEMKRVYMRIFKRIGIGHVTYITVASGGTFSKFSHEFQMLTSSGEDIIYLDETNSIAVNKEVFTDEVLEDLGLSRDNLKEHRAIEVGNIFPLLTRFSEPLGLTFTDEDGTKKPVIMGSYGIGLSRLMGAVVEALSDDAGIIWPEDIAPFRIHLVSLSPEAEEVYSKLSLAGIETFFDDRSEVSAGEKFADADLIGIPYRVVVSKRSLEDGGVEVKERTEEKGKVIPLSDLITQLQSRG